MSITKKIALTKTTLLPETLAATAEARALAELRARFPKESEAELRVRMPKPMHTCEIPKVTQADGMAPGSVHTCDECGKRRELVFFSYPNPYAEPGDDSSRWAWRNLPTADEQAGVGAWH